MKTKYPAHITSASDRAMFHSFPMFLFYLWTKCLSLPKPTRIQYDIAEYLQGGPVRRMIMAFRGLGKSWITCAYACWRLWKNCQLRILIVSANEKKATENATFIQQLINTVPILTHLAGGEGRESVLAFDVRGADPNPSPSVRCDGIFGQITGGRADIIIADDLEVPKNSETEAMREKLEKRTREFAAVKTTRKDTDEPSEIIWLGTPQTEESIYRSLKDKGYDIRVWPARYPTAENLAHYGGHLAPLLLADMERSSEIMLPAVSTCGGAPTDPERFDEAALMAAEAEYKRSGFTLQYQLDTRLSDAERYPLKLRDLIVMQLDKEIGPVQVTWASGKEQHIPGLPNLGFDGDRYHGPMYVSKDSFVKWQGSVLVVDPKGRGKDEVGYAVTRSLNGRIYLAASGGLPGGYDDATLEKLATIAKDYAVNEVLVEGNFGDGMYLKIFAPILKRIYPCTLTEFDVTGQKELRILDKLEPVIEGHRLVVDEALIRKDAEEEVPRENRLMYQLTHITRERGCLKRDDRIDVLAEAVGYWTAHMVRDAKDAEDEHKEKLRKLALEAFMRRCKALKPGAAGRTKYVRW